MYGLSVLGNSDRSDSDWLAICRTICSVTNRPTGRDAKFTPRDSARARAGFVMRSDEWGWVTWEGGFFENDNDSFGTSTTTANLSPTPRISPAFANRYTKPESGEVISDAALVVSMVNRSAPF